MQGAAGLARSCLAVEVLTLEAAALTPAQTGGEFSVEEVLSEGVGFESFTEIQLEESARCNIDYGKAGSPCRAIRYTSPSILRI